MAKKSAKSTGSKRKSSKAAVEKAPTRKTALTLGGVISKLRAEISEVAAAAAAKDSDAPSFAIANVDFELSFSVVEESEDGIRIALSGETLKGLPADRLQKIKFSLLDLEVASLTTQMPARGEAEK